MLTINVVTPPATEPLTLAEAKAHLRVDGTDEDTLITALIIAARESIETWSRRQLLTATLKLSLDEFPCGDGVIRIPRPPLQSVSSIQYVDTAGDLQTLAAERYQVDALGQPGRVAPAYGTHWPATRDQLNAVHVTFVAGYTSPPQTSKHLARLLVGHFYANREAVDSGLEEMPLGVKALAATLKWGDYQ